MQGILYDLYQIGVCFLDRNVYFRYICHLLKDFTTHHKMRNIFHYDLIIGSNIRLTFHRIDNNTINSIRFLILHIGRKTGSTQADNSGLFDLLNAFFSCCRMIIQRHKCLCLCLRFIQCDNHMIHWLQHSTHTLFNSHISSRYTGIQRHKKTRLCLRQFCTNLYLVAFTDKDFKVCIGTSGQRDIDFFFRHQRNDVFFLCQTFTSRNMIMHFSQKQ